MKKNPAEIAGTRYKDEKLMSRVQKTDGTSRCFAQMKTLNDSPYFIVNNNFIAGFRQCKKIINCCKAALFVNAQCNAIIFVVKLICRLCASDIVNIILFHKIQEIVTILFANEKTMLFTSVY